MSTSNDTARQRVEKAIFQVRGHRELIGIGPIMDRWEGVIMLPGHGTAATDGKYLYFDPAFVERLAQSTLRTVIVHEAMHVAYSHHLRMEPFSDDERKRRTANIAMDHVINNAIIKMDAWRSGFLTQPDPDLWCCDSKYADQSEWSFDKVFRDIYEPDPSPPEQTGGSDTGEDQPDDQPEDQPDDQQQDGPQDGGGQADEDDLGDDESGSGQDDDGQDEQQDGSSGGDGDERGQPQSQPQSQPKSQSQSQSQSQSDPGPQAQSGGGVAPDGQPLPETSSHGLGDILPSRATSQDEANAEHQQIQDNLAMGSFMEKMMGVGSGTNSLMGSIVEATDEGVSEWDWIRELLRSVYADDRTWATPNVFHLDHGFLPGRHKTSGELHVRFDLSGSMSQDELKICYNNLMAICQDVGVHTVKVGYFDYYILHPEDRDEGEPWDEYDVYGGDEPELKILGRGGTHFDPIFQQIEDEDEDVQALIIFTDGEAYTSWSDPGYPVIWATTTREPGFRDKETWGEAEPFGEVVKLDYSPWWQR